MKQIAIIGIDPGQSGGLAAWIKVDQDELWRTFELPMQLTGKGSRRQLDLDALYKTLQGLNVKIDLAVVEVPPIIPTNGSLSIAGLHRGYGEIRGLLKGLSIAAEYVPAATWQKAILPGKSSGKGASISYVRDRYPTIDFKAAPKIRGKNKGVVEYLDGISDAVCIAEYGRRQLLGQSATAIA